MTISVIINKNEDGSPDGTATVHACNPTGIHVSAGYGKSQQVSFTEDIGHVASALGSGLELIKQAEANEDPPA